MEKVSKPRKKRSKELEEYPGVRKRGKGYTYRYDLPIIEPDGKPGRKQKETAQYPTPLEAYQAGILIEAELLKGTYVDEKNITFLDWTKKGLEMHASTESLKQNTIDVYNANIAHAKTYFAGRKLKSITQEDYEKFLKYLRDERKLGESAIKGAHNVMGILFRLAVKFEIISRDPTVGVKKPKIAVTFEDLEALEDSGLDEPLPEYLEKEQLATLLKAAKARIADQTDPAKAFGARQHYRLIYILAHTGLRIGELCSLVKSRVNTKQRTIRIIASIYKRRGIANYELTLPKTKSSVRTVDISGTVAAVFESQFHDLKVFKLSIGEKFYGGREFAVVSYKRLPGYPLNPETFSADLAETLKLAGLPESITPHSLRHTFTSLSAEAGVPLEDIQRQLGHESDAMTKRVYLHVTEARRRANVDKLDTLTRNLLPDLN